MEKKNSKILGKLILAASVVSALQMLTVACGSKSTGISGESNDNNMIFTDLEASEKSVDPCAADPCAAKMPEEIFSVEPSYTESVEPEPIIAAMNEPSLQAFIAQKYQQLFTGDFFYYIPEKLKVGTGTTIRAGIAGEVTEELLERLNLDPESTQVSAMIATYDPVGTEISLWVSNGAKIEPIGTGGRKPIMKGREQAWMWNVVPIQSGNHEIIVLGKVEFSQPGSDDISIHEYELYSGTHHVSSNLPYSTGAFVSRNTTQLIGLILAPGSIGALITFLYVRRQEKAKALAKAEHLVAAEEQTNKIGFLR